MMVLKYHVQKFMHVAIHHTLGLIPFKYKLPQPSPMLKIMVLGIALVAIALVGTMYIFSTYGHDRVVGEHTLRWYVGMTAA